MLFNSDVYRKSFDTHPKDIMSSYSSAPAAGADKNPLSVTGLSSYFNKVDREQNPTISQTLMGNTSNQTLMAKLLPNNSYKVSANTSSMMRKPEAGKSISDGGQVADVRAGAQQEVKAQMGRLTADVKQLKVETDDSLKQTANDLGINAGDAAHTFCTSAESTNLTAALSVGADLCFAGAGSLVTMGRQAGPVAVELSEKDKKLDIKQQESILENEVARLQSPGSNATMDDPNAGSTIKYDVALQSKFAYENIDIDDLREIHSLNSDNLAQNLPEMAELENLDNALGEVADHHGYLGNRADVDFGGPDPVNADGAIFFAQSLREVPPTVIDESANNADYGMASISDISEMFNRQNPDDNIPAYKPPEKMLDQMIGINS